MHCVMCMIAYNGIVCCFNLFAGNVDAAVITTCLQCYCGTKCRCRLGTDVL